MNSLFNLDNQLCFEIYKASNLFTKRYRQILSSYDLTYPQYIVLLVLWENNHLYIKQLSEKLELGIGTLNPVINKLVEKNWITKKTDLEDKRAMIISLTSKAQEMETVITNAVISAFSQCTPLLDLHADLKPRLYQLNDILKKMNDLEE